MLLHPKDVTDLQFTPTKDKKGKIPLEVEVSLINIELNREKRANTALTSESGEILPENTVKELGTNRYTETSEISPKATANEKSGDLPKNPAWFQRPIICVSKWSKALKTGVVHSIGRDINHTAYRNQEEDDKHGFSFFL